MVYVNGIQENARKFTCINCAFISSNKYDYDRHIATRKHKNALNGSNKNAKALFVCICGRQYKYNSGYYRHKKTCDFQINELDKVAELCESCELDETDESDKLKNIIINKEDIDYGKIITELKNIIIDQHKQLGDQQKQIGELIPKIGNNNYNNNNNIKQKFNINVFLNEQCKDAITMNKFIDNLKITMEDLFLTKDKGITEGITNIITKNMNKLSLYERPLHCTDVKRETVYIKSEGESGKDSQWEKDKQQNKLKKAIKDATYMQSKNLNLYTESNPDWMEKEDKQMEYMKMVKNSTDDIYKDNKLSKVVKKICNNVYYNGDE